MKRTMKIVLWSFLMVLPQFVWSDVICTTAFELRQGMILVEGDINGQSGSFILDTGSPGLVLNKKYFTGTPSTTLAYGFNTKVEVQALVISLFRWECIEKKRITSWVLDLAEMERGLGEKILGLIGYEILQEKELLVDYEKMHIEQRALFSKSSLPLPDAVLSFALDEHLAIIKIDVAGITRDMILDSGSETSIMAENEQTLTFYSEDASIIVGLDKVKSSARIVNIEVNMPSGRLVLEMLISNGTNTLVDKGLLGSSFLNQYKKWSINYHKQRLSLWGN